MRDHLPGDDRMQMEMLVGVDVVERQPGRAKRLELRFDLGCELPPDARAEAMSSPTRAMSARNRPCASTRSGTLSRRQRRPALDQHEMQPDAQARQPPRPRDRVGRGGRRRHQARGRQNAVAMRLLDGLVDLGREAEIVGVTIRRLMLGSTLRRRS